MHHQHRGAAAAACRKAAQQRAGTRAREGRAVHGHSRVLQMHGFDAPAAENVDILRPGQGGVGRERGPGIVVARRDEDLCPDAAERFAEHLRGLPVDAIGIKEVPGEKQKMAAAPTAFLRQILQDLTLLLPALGSLLRHKGGKGTVQMEISSVQDSYHGIGSFLFGYRLRFSGRW